MRSSNLLRFLVYNILGLGAGASIAVSCVTVDYSTFAFRCSPRQEDNCPDGYICCSDDPAAQFGRLPAYMGRGGNGTPIFSGAFNSLSTSGMCVDVAKVPAGSGLIEFNNCPVPCNPEWNANQVQAICGSWQCCQTVEVTDRDCVFDSVLAKYRPATGADLFSDPPLTDWAPARHDTHQDASAPELAFGCKTFAQASGGDVYEDCLRQLSVANQRGFCLSVAQCPTTLPTFIDACERLNGGGAPPAGP